MDTRGDIGQEFARRVSHSIAKRIAMGITLFIVFLIFITIGGLVVQWLWNWLMPEIFRIPQITYWQGLGLLALSRILFGGFGRQGGSAVTSKRRRQDWWGPHEPRQSPPSQPDAAAI